METDDKTPTDSPPADTHSPDLLSRLREKTARYIAQAPESGLLAPALRRWEERSGPSPDALAQSLELDEDGWNRLALCRKPRDDHFAADTDAIAEYLGCDAGKLLSFLRRLQVMSGFAATEDSSAANQASAAPSPGWNGLLVAARDREENDTGDDGETPDER